MSTDVKRARRRAVRLTPEALDILKRAVLEEWAKRPDVRKLTREERARLLGVSVGTAERVWRGSGVDRPTLIHAFSSLGLTWEDAYCEFVSVAPAASNEPSEKQVQPIWRVIAASALVVLATLFSLKLGPGEQIVPTSDWRVECSRLIDEGDKAFHQGRYSDATAYLDRAISIARYNEGASHLATALRLSGDVASAMGSFADARDCYTEALSLRRILKHHASKPSILEALGNAELKLGDQATARKHLLESLEGYKAAGDRVGVALANRSLGNLHFENKEPAQARVSFEAALSSVKGLGKRDIEMDVRAGLALVLRDEGKLAEARKILHDCLAYWQARKHPRWLAKTKFELATVASRAGQSSVAAKLLEESKAGFVLVGDRLGVRRCGELLRDRVGNASGSSQKPL